MLLPRCAIAVRNNGRGFRSHPGQSVSLRATCSGWHENSDELHGQLSFGEKIQRAVILLLTVNGRMGKFFHGARPSMALDGYEAKTGMIADKKILLAIR